MTGALFRYSGIFAGGFLLFSILAFWPSYFSRPPSQFDIRFHLHTLSLTLWCLLLAGQGVLIRTNHRRLHRRLGQASYGLVPFVVVAAAGLAHYGLRRGADEIPTPSLYTLSLVFNQLAMFVALWGLAMWHRRQPALHARYMLCTLLPLFSAPMSRVVIHFTQGVIGLIAGLGGTTLGVYEIAYSFPVYLFLTGLSVWDWRTHDRIKVFPVALGLMILLQVSVLATYRTPWWRAFGEWFFDLPLS